MKKSKLTKIIRKEIETYHALKEPKEEFIYPMYFKEKHSDLIVKFRALYQGIVVQGYSVWDIGDESVAWIPHTNTSIWEQVDFKEEVEVAVEPEIEYPVFLINNRNKTVFKYTNNNTCYFVIHCNKNYTGSDTRCLHGIVDLKKDLASGNYTKLACKKEIDLLYDGQPAIGWDYHRPSRKMLCVIDIHNDGVFNHEGLRNGYEYDKIKVLTTEQIKAFHSEIWDGFKALNFNVEIDEDEEV